MVHVSAGNPFRRWPEPAFAGWSRRSPLGSPSRRIVLSSGPSDRDAAARIADAAPARSARERRACVDFGEFDLAELQGAHRAQPRCSSAATPGPLHIAATTATPIVGIYGPTLAERSAPWRDPRDPRPSRWKSTGLPCRPCDQRVCAPGDFRCLTTLSPKTVIAAAERALSAQRT